MIPSKHIQLLQDLGCSFYFIPLTLCGNGLEVSSTLKLLSVIFDEKLTLKSTLYWCECFPSSQHLKFFSCNMYCIIKFINDCETDILFFPELFLVLIWVINLILVTFLQVFIDKSFVGEGSLFNSHIIYISQLMLL